MNALNILVKSYSKLHNYPFVPVRFVTPFRFALRSISNIILPYFLSIDSGRTCIKKTDVIVSFTSFPARIANVWQVVECMKRQTYKPSKILLWLSSEQFPTKDSIPENLWSRQDDIFEIRFVERDIRSHKKYYYVSKAYPETYIFLIDDDCYYPTDIIQRSMNAHCQNPGSIICNYGYHVKFDEMGNVLPYDKWAYENYKSSSDDLFFGSGGGTLFKPSEMYEDLTNIDLARRLCPIADDVWLNAMAKLAKKPISLLDNGLMLPIHNRQNVELATVNIGESMNDKQIKNLIEHYGNVFRVL